MIELVLALQLLGGPGAAPPSRLVPPLSLGGEARLAQVRPDLAGIPPELGSPDPGRRPVRVTTVLGASAGVALADLASMVPIVYGMLLCLDEVVSWGQSSGCGRGTPFIVGGLLSFVFLPPAAGVLGARAAGERGDAGGKAYLYALLVRLGAFGLATVAPGDLGVVAVLGAELVLAPWVIGYTLAGAAPPGVVAWQGPVVAAVPVRDPVAWARR